jgi:ADP-ribosylglycohydrolase
MYAKKVENPRVTGLSLRPSTKRRIDDIAAAENRSKGQTADDLMRIALMVYARHNNLLVAMQVTEEENDRRGVHALPE